MALALPDDGRLVACDISDEWTGVARTYWQRAGVADKIDLRVALALTTLAQLEREGALEGFDLAFIDADKTGYDAYYEAALRLVRPGGLIVLDNMLRRGRVADPRDGEADTVALRNMNTKITSWRDLHPPAGPLLGAFPQSAQAQVLRRLMSEHVCVEPVIDCREFGQCNPLVSVQSNSRRD
jgi:predicted O-methyltransferase YrrM